MPTPLERYRGCLLGLACGDALGTSIEFSPPGSFPPVKTMTGGGPFHLKPGQWTDDTSMALCLADSLVERGEFDPVDQMERYLRWHHEGYLSSNGVCFDIGGATSSALRRFKRTRDPYAGSTDAKSAGNGSLMRLAPVPMAYSPDLLQAVERSADSSRTTHAAQTCIDACRYYGLLIALALQGASKDQLLAPLVAPKPGYWDAHPLHPEIREIAQGSFKHRLCGQIPGSRLMGLLQQRIL
jgi:ADP-ribosylglycohydrolase